MESECRSIPAFIDAMDALVSQTMDPYTCVAFVQHTLPGLLQSGNCLSSTHTEAATESYARHLVYRHPQGRYVVVAMVWRSGQHTPIHDHGGVWCVEGIYQGQMHITQYNVTPIDHDHVKADPVRSFSAGLGSVGALIPPHEYHVMANTSRETAVTLHVYGADLKCCRVFIDHEEGIYRVQQRELHYTSGKG